MTPKKVCRPSRYLSVESKDTADDTGADPIPFAGFKVVVSKLDTELQEVSDYERAYAMNLRRLGIGS